MIKRWKSISMRNSTFQPLFWTFYCMKETHLRKCHFIRVRWKLGQFGVIRQWPNVKDKRFSRTFEHESLNSYKQLHTVTFDHLLKGNKRAYIRRKFKCQFWEKEQYLFLKSQGFERADWTLKITSFNPTILGHKILSFWERLKYVFCFDFIFILMLVENYW